jgi:hypothetical protein
MRFLAENGHDSTDRVLPARTDVLEHSEPARIWNMVLVVDEQRRIAIEGKDEDGLTAHGIAREVLDLVRHSAVAESEEHSHVGGAHLVPHAIPSALKLTG